MGACLSCVCYPDEIGRDAIKQKFDNACDISRHESGHSYSGEIGMLHGIRQWVDVDLPNENAAYDYLSDNHEKWDPAMAVSYRNKDGKKYWLIGGWCSS